MWRRSAKVVDIAMTARLQGRINQGKVKYIINIIFKYTLPMLE